jgi:hypothetical protein
MIEEYFESVKALFQNASLAQPPEDIFDRRDKETGFLRGDLVFTNGSRLHFREFVNIKPGKPANRYMYAFQYMRADGTLVFRYDDADHFLKLPFAPHHKHIGENDLVAADAPDLQSVLKEIEALIQA